MSFVDTCNAYSIVGDVNFAASTLICFQKGNKLLCKHRIS